MTENLPAKRLTQEQLSNSIRVEREGIIKSITDEFNLEHAPIQNLVQEGFKRFGTEAAFGRSEVNPSTVRSMAEAGIMPIEYSPYKKLMRQKKGRGLLDHIKEHNITLASTKGYRMRCAYRLLRYMARIRGDLPGFPLLENALAFDWKVPRNFDDRFGFSTGVKGIRGMLYYINEQNITYSFWDGNEFKTVQGVTYLPPQIPDQAYIAAGANGYEEIWDARINHIVPKGYDPNNDKSLVYYCEVMELLAHHLNIWDGTVDEPHAGEYGMAGLLTPAVCRMAWPTRDEVIMYEQELMLAIFDIVSNTASTINAEKQLQNDLGITRMEAMDLVRTSTERISEYYKEDQERSRTIILSQLGSLADQAKGTDLRLTAAVFKEQAKLRGLSRSEDTTVQEQKQEMLSKAIAMKSDEGIVD